MNRTTTLVTLFTLGTGIIANSCGNDRDTDTAAPSNTAGGGGSSGRGGSLAGHGGAVAAGDTAMSDHGANAGASEGGEQTNPHMQAGGRAGAGAGPSKAGANGVTARGGNGGTGDSTQSGGAAGEISAGAGGEGPVDIGQSSSGASNEGGAAGVAGAGNEGGAAGTSPSAPTCLEVGLTSWAENVGAGDVLYFSSIAGSADADEVDLLAYSNDDGLLELGSGLESSFFSCDKCLVINVPDESGGTTKFFAMDGTLDIAESSEPLSGLMDATLSDVTFVQLGSDYLPITGGKCLHLASSSISLP